MIREKLATLESEVKQLVDEINERNAYINRALGAIEVLKQLIAKEEGNENVDNNSGGKEQEQAANGEGN